MNAAAPAPLSIFLAAPPGLEPTLAEEARALGFAPAEIAPGGVLIFGDWPEVWRAHLRLRIATRVLVRIAAFPVGHLAQLDKRARQIPWADLLRPDRPARVEAACKRSRIYHSGAAAQRVETAIRESVGAPIAAEARMRVLARIEKDLCEISLDVSGEPLHKRGFKQAIGKAPLRETLAAALLRQCGYRGAEPVLDPMCGSGTFVIEAAEIAAGRAPGRGRSFAFEDLAGFDPAAWARMREAAAAEARLEDAPRCFGFDRDAGAVEGARANAARAGVGEIACFARQAISDLARPEGPPGLVMVNPPYGARIGEAGDLRALYGALGKVLTQRFAGWRVGLVTSEPALARATALPFVAPGPPIPHGALKIRLYRTDPL